MPKWFRLAASFAILAISLLTYYLKSGPVRLALTITMVVLAVVAVVMAQREGRASGADTTGSLNLRR